MLPRRGSEVTLLLSLSTSQGIDAQPRTWEGSAEGALPPDVCCFSSASVAAVSLQSLKLLRYVAEFWNGVNGSFVLSSGSALSVKCW